MLGNNIYVCLISVLYVCFFLFCRDVLQKPDDARAFRFMAVTSHVSLFNAIVSCVSDELLFMLFILLAFAVPQRAEFHRRNVYRGQAQHAPAGQGRLGDAHHRGERPRGEYCPC